MKWLLWPILVLYLLFTSNFGIVNPLFEAPDEQHHFFTALAIAEQGHLPRADINALARQEAAQPPLYYMLAAVLLKLTPGAQIASDLPPTSNPNVHPGNFDALNNFNAFIHPPAEAWPWQGQPLAVHILRFFSTLLGLGTLLFIHQSGRLLWPRAPTKAILATALVAFLPQFEFIHAAVTNDTLIILLCSAALWQMIRIYDKATGRRWLGLSCTIGLATLTKLTGFLLFGCAILLLIITAWRRGDWRRIVGHACLLLLPALLMAGWLFVRNWQLYGTLTAVNVFITFAGGDQNFPLWVITQQLDRVGASALAVFGWMNVLPPRWIYQIWLLVLLWALGGLTIGAMRGIRLMMGQPQNESDADSPLPQRHGHHNGWLWAILGSWPILVTAAWVQFALHTHADQGRLLFPALLPVALLLAHGLTQWPIPYFHLLVLCVLVVPPPFLAGYWLPQRYAPMHALTNDILPEDAEWRRQIFGDQVELVAIQRKTPVVEVGAPIAMTLFWRKLTQSDEAASISLEVVGRDYKSIGELPLSYHGGGTTPSTLWPVDTIMAEPVTLPTAPDASAPTVGRIWLRVAGQADLSEVGTVKLVPQQWPPGVADPVARIGDGIFIGRTELSPTQSSPGGTVTLRLQWQITRAPAQELITFVHLGDPTQPPLAQGDGPPLHGDYPTQLWAAGEVFADSYTLALPADLLAGTYPVYVGLYEPNSGQRQPLWQGKERLPHDGLLAGWLTVADP